MRVIVTGGTGFVGRHLIDRLRRDGATVHALARSDSAAAKLQAIGAEPLRGDLATGPLAFPEADAVVHAAAHFHLSGPLAPFVATNVEGTARVIEATRAAGIPRMVHVSAAAVVMDDRGSALHGADESARTFPDSRFPYIATKAQAEARVLAAHGPSLTTLALRPPAIWGPGDRFSQVLPVALRGGRFGFVDRGAAPCVTCHVGNLVEAIHAALRAGPEAGGRAYFVNDAEPIAFRAFVEGLARALGLGEVRAPSMPYPVVRTVGGAMEAVWRLLGRPGEPPMSRPMVRLIGRPFVTSDAAARARLGYAPRVSRAAGLAAYA